jgi:hypothetical protein
MTAQTDADRDDPPMHRRRTTMFDGRTMYYYTFGKDAEGASRQEQEGDATHDASTEERDV